ncbi:anti-sigma factor antagonist [Heyndrickxia oleronia]|uniref:Anti-sigma factor antagonist n=1 Tax=Heyndrickxia oleronia TaxID=38875 RepID=A0AAW6SXA9_9BACI|nr:anti-sigma factor antagonist [Heyndrickxia oleronia]MCM3239937.1 anti-sigma factor antagonist [Heyndrickxia oleronia]MDH5162755.1 anti-sigma factor antagonist [Heyndrickxia oleronia]
MNISIDIQEIDNHVFAKINGEIDAYTAPKLREALIPFNDKYGIEMSIDLSGVTYMDSTGLGVFVGLFKGLRTNEGKLSLNGLTSRIERLFDITGLSKIMDINTEVEGGV